MCGEQPHLQPRLGRSRRRWLHLGTIPAGEIGALTSGLFSQDVPVRLNRRDLDYDQIIICGPVFPHEVVGFSGGNKYFFPGIAGAEIIDFTHWLGAVMTNYAIIGAGYTPVRARDRPGRGVHRQAGGLFLSRVLRTTALHGLYFGSPDAWPGRRPPICPRRCTSPGSTNRCSACSR